MINSVCLIWLFCMCRDNGDEKGAITPLWALGNTPAGDLLNVSPWKWSRVHEKIRL